MTNDMDPTAPEEGSVPADAQQHRDPADPDLLHGGSGENEPPDGPEEDEATDDLLNGGSGENEPPIERKDGQVYGG